MSASTALRVDAALLALLWIGSLAAWPALPDPFPVHFDLAGQPDRWATRTTGGFVMWMLLPAIVTATSALLRWAPRAASANPWLWNMPRKNDLLALPPERRAPVYAIMTRMMGFITVMTTALFVLVQASIWSSAHGSPIPGVLMLVAVIVYSIVAIVFAAVATQRAGAAIAETMKGSPKR